MTTFSDLKKIADVLKKAGKINEFNQILGLQEQLLNMQDQMAKLKQEKEEMQRKNKKLEEKLNLKDDLEPRNNAYWRKSNGDGPFCTKCFDESAKTIRIPVEKKGYSVCPKCKNDFNLTGEEVISEYAGEEVSPLYPDIGM